MELIRLVLAETVRRSLHPISIAIWLAASVLAALAGPFGTFNAGSIELIALYWMIVIGTAIPLGHAIRILVTECLSHRPVMQHDVMVPSIMAMLYTPFVMLCNRVILGKPPDEGVSQLMFFLTVLIIACMVSILIVVFRNVAELDAGDRGGRDRGANTGGATTGDDALRPRLLDRIGAPAGAGLLRMTVDDHYVIIHLDDGSVHRLLMRFADAVAEASGIDGFLTHRSHWVAVQAVQGLERDAGREVVMLIDGSSVPVSRTFRSHLAALLSGPRDDGAPASVRFTRRAEAPGSRTAR